MCICSNFQTTNASGDDDEAEFEGEYVRDDYHPTKQWFMKYNLRDPSTSFVDIRIYVYSGVSDQLLQWFIK